MFVFRFLPPVLDKAAGDELLFSLNGALSFGTRGVFIDARRLERITPDGELRFFIAHHCVTRRGGLVLVRGLPSSVPGQMTMWPHWTWRLTHVIDLEEAERRLESMIERAA